MYRIFVPLALLFLFACGNGESNEAPAAEKPATTEPATEQPAAPAPEPLKVERAQLTDRNWTLVSATDLSTGQILPQSAMPPGFSVTFKENGEFANVDGATTTSGQWSLRGDVVDVKLPNENRPMYVKELTDGKLVLDFDLHGKSWSMTFTRAATN